MSVDLNNIKTQIKSILDTANTTTATNDLSSGMVNRVQSVQKVNIQKIPIQSTLFPYVSISVDTKSIEQATIAKNQVNAKRLADIDIRVAGGVWDDDFSSLEEDAADEEIEKLMENIEEVLRENPDLNSSVLWQVPSDVTYHAFNDLDEETHMRIGIMTLECKVQY